MTGDKNVLEGDIAEQCFDSLWTDLAGYKPSKPDPDRDGIDRETYARVGGEGDERVRLLFQIKGRLIHQQAPPNVTIRVTASNIHNWHGTNDPVYFAVVVGKSKERQLVSEEFRKTARIFIANAQSLTSNIDLSKIHDSDVVSVRVPLTCELSHISHAMIAGSQLIAVRTRRFSMALDNVLRDTDLSNSLKHYMQGGADIDLSYKSFRSLIADLDWRSRRAISTIVGATDSWVRTQRILQTISVRKGQSVYIVATESLSDEIAALLFLGPALHWINHSAHWATISKAKLHRIFLIPDDLKQIPAVRKYLLFIFIAYNKLLGVEYALLPESFAKERVERLVLPNNYTVQNWYIDKGGEWHTEVSRAWNKARIDTQLVEAYWNEAVLRSTDTPSLAEIAEFFGLQELLPEKLTIPDWADVIYSYKSPWLSWPRLIL